MDPNRNSHNLAKLNRQILQTHSTPIMYQPESLLKSLTITLVSPQALMPPTELLGKGFL